jgi:hypothetical protein
MNLSRGLGHRLHVNSEATCNRSHARGVTDRLWIKAVAPITGVDHPSFLTASPIAWTMARRFSKGGGECHRRMPPVSVSKRAAG